MFNDANSKYPVPIKSPGMWWFFYIFWQGWRRGMAAPGLQSTESLCPSKDETGNEWSKEEHCAFKCGIVVSLAHRTAGFESHPAVVLAWRDDLCLDLWLWKGKEIVEIYNIHSIAASSSHTGLGEKNIPMVMNMCDGVKQEFSLYCSSSQKLRRNELCNGEEDHNWNVSKYLNI